MHLIERLPATRVALSRYTRVGVVAGLLVLGFVVLIPTWIVLPADDEGLFTRDRADGLPGKASLLDYPFWDPWIGFGVPHPRKRGADLPPLCPARALRARLSVSIALLYQVQLWIGLFSVWAVCRYLGLHHAGLGTLRPHLRALCGDARFPRRLLARPAGDLDDPASAPAAALLKLLDSERRSSRVALQRVDWSLRRPHGPDGHAGVFPSFAVGFVAFMIGSARRAIKLWPWLLVALVVFAFTISTKVYDIALEAARTASASQRPQQAYDMDFARPLPVPAPREWARLPRRSRSAVRSWC